MSSDPTSNVRVYWNMGDGRVMEISLERWKANPDTSIKEEDLWVPYSDVKHLMSANETSGKPESEPLVPKVECKKCGRTFLTYKVGLDHIEHCEQSATRGDIAPRFSEKASALPERTCIWTPIEDDSPVYNTCGEEWQLNEGCELYPYCHNCGGKIVVPECPWCGGPHIGSDCHAPKASAENGTALPSD